MSLVGNLEDLSLGDILQIISLSQKSGVLALASDHGSGRIVFRSGLVYAACLKGGARDLRQLLVGGGFLEPSGYDAALLRSRDLGVDVEETLALDAGMSTQRIDELIRESVEVAILEMFTWPAGDFSFDVRSERDPEDPNLIMLNGLNAQYLAMEGLRLCDERARDDIADSNELTQPSIETALGDPLFGPDLLEVEPSDGETEPLLIDEDDVISESLPEAFLESTELLELALPEASPAAVDGAIEEVDQAPESGAAADLLVDRILTRSESLDEPEEGVPSPEPLAPPTGKPAPSTIAPVSATGVTGRRSTDADRPNSMARSMPVVLIDPDVTVLEWIKGAIEADFARVHVFQQADQGLARIRQYLIRGQIPLLLISSDTQIDPLSGIHGLGDFVKRLKAQAPRLIALGLREDEDVAPVAMPSNLDGVLRRPGRKLIRERASASGDVAAQVLARALLEILVHRQGPKKALVSEQVDSSSDALRDMLARLKQASSRGEILPMVLEFAGKLFERVAILIARDTDIFAIAGHGIPALGVDPLSSAPPAMVESIGPGLVRTVLTLNESLVAAPETPADFDLLRHFGSDRPSVAYVSPIGSGSSVIALLYADQGESGQPMPDARGLEIVLQHAGMALDRAALERAQWEAGADGR